MTEPALHFHTSNRLGTLAEHLAGILAADPLPPLEREVVVVSSQGMRRWLTLALADRLGIAAGLALPSPGAFCRHLAERVLDARGAGELENASPSLFDRGLLTWRIFAHLGGAAAPAPRPGPGAYLEDDPDQVKRFQLSARLASLFDGYQLYRPRTVLEWQAGAAGTEAGAHADWQARLWRALTEGAGEEPPARRVHRLRELLRRSQSAPAGLPRRLAVFGAGTLPPAFLDLLAALARFVPVRLYFTSPTYHYWGDLRSEREAASIRQRLRTSRRAADDDHLEGGNPLLAGLGRQGRDFFNLLQDADPDGAAWHELEFSDPGDGCLLHVLQSDVLHVVDRGGDGVPARRLEPGDDSLSVHVCHSPRREMEVLRDQLLDAFRRDPTLEPSDVAVMVPEIGAYSPYVEAVFGVEWQGTPALPFTLADRRAGQERPLAETVTRVLGLVAGRVTPRDVFDLLDVAAIRRAFSIAAGEVPVLRRWVRDTRIRWGVDGAQRAADFALPLEDANTWRAGLDRLLMGYAAGDVPERLAGVAPHAGATAGDAALLGRLADFADTLFRHLGRLRDPRSLDVWAADLGALVEAFYRAGDDEEESALELVREALFDLTRARELAGVSEPVTRTAVRAHLERRLAAEGLGTGFSSGRITFCELTPLRAVPFRVIAVAGLSDGAFPRRDPRRSFDLMAQAPRPGDRSRVQDDRYLFLETLLSAGDRLILTYVGRSEKDNRPQAPSPVVSELLDVVDRAFTTGDGRPAREVVVVEHRLHAFDTAYYGAGDPRLFSYSRESCRAGSTRAAPPAPMPFIAAGTADAGGCEAEDDLELEVTDLMELWVHPARHYCRRTLQLALELESGELEEAEPFDVGFLDRYRLRQWLLERRLEGLPAGAEELELLRARGELPLAGLGEAAYSRVELEVDRFAATLPRFRRAEPVLVELAGRGWRLHGRLEDLTDVGLLRFRCADLKPKDLLRAWVLHVVRNAWEARRPTGLPRATHAIGTDRSVRFRAPGAAPELLEGLVAGYREGLESPLPVFERASKVYVEQRRQRDAGGRPRVPPLVAARRAYDGGRFPGDAANPYAALCFRDRDPLAEPAFARWAEALWTPLLDHLEERGA